MPLKILSNADVATVLSDLSRAEILDLQLTLKDSLHEYSTGAQDAECCSANQPKRQLITKNGQTTIFMPASAKDLFGIKTVSIPEGVAAHFRPAKKVKGGNTGGQQLAAPPSTDSLSSSLKRTSISSSHSRSGSVTSSLTGTTTTTGSSISAPAGGVASSLKFTDSDSSLDTTIPTPMPNRTLTLMSPTGAPTALLNATDLTAFRTALASTLLFTRRSHVGTITVFGAGRQAYWHIRLAILLRGPDIKHVNIINRSFERAQSLLQEFYHPSNAAWRGHVKFAIVTPGHVEFDRLLKEHVRKADVVFTCTPAHAPLFPAEYLTSSEARRKGRYIAAIGSFKPHMTELHPDVFRSAVNANRHHDDGHHHIHWHKHAPSAGVVVVDSLDTCLRDAGELIQAEISPDQLVEVGELIIVKKAYLREKEDAMARAAAAAGAEGQGKKGVEQEMEKGWGSNGMVEWLEKGNVLYKSVGFGMLDVVVGAGVVELARQRGIGTIVQEF